MKSIFVATACVALSSTVGFAQQAEVPRIKAMLVKASGKTVTKRPLLIERITRGTIFYRENPTTVTIGQVKIRGLKGIYMARPKEYVEAVELFENRKYELAFQAFGKVKEKYKPMADIKNSYVALASLYQLDCFRKLKQYDKLAKAEKVFSRGKYLTKRSQQQQVEIYKLWGSLVDKEYPLIINQYETKWKTLKLTGSLRAQVEFIYGRALEASNRPSDALTAYSKALIADFANSEVISREAIDSSFRIIEADKDIQEIKRMWDSGETPELLKLKINTQPYLKLVEAGALVRVHDKLALSGYDKDGKMIKLTPSQRKYKKYTRKAGNALLQDK